MLFQNMLLSVLATISLVAAQPLLGLPVRWLEPNHCMILDSPDSLEVSWYAISLKILVFHTIAQGANGSGC